MSSPYKKYVSSPPYCIITEFHDFLFLQRLLAPDIDEHTRQNARNLLDSITHLFARQIFDYSFAACLGEARHSHKRCYNAYISEFDSTNHSRDKVYLESYRFDPNIALPTLIKLFTNYAWESSYGGESWGNIAEKTYQWWIGNLKDTVYIDTVAYLNHNGGIYLDKGFIFSLSSPGYLRGLLDFKRHNDLIHDFDKLLFIANQKCQPFYMSTPVFDLVKDFIPGAHLKIMKTKKLTIVNLGYTPIEYGTENIELIKVDIYSTGDHNAEGSESENNRVD